MTITHDALIYLIREIMEGPLREYDFTFCTERFLFERGFFGFYKAAKNFDLYLYIEVQPRGFGDDQIISFFINIIRTDVADLHADKWGEKNDISKFNLRMTHWIFQDYQGPPWQEFQAAFENVAKENIKDALSKIIKYGIPFLEDPTSSWPLSNH